VRVVLLAALLGRTRALASDSSAKALNPIDLLHSASSDTGVCDLCGRDFLVVLATGRSGSTSLMEALNSLPGVNLRGENSASIVAAQELYERATKTGLAASDRAALEHGPLDEQRLLCKLQDFFVAFDPPTARRPNVAHVHGFKELVLPSSLAANTTRQHLPDSPDGWVDFMQKLFPCGRFVLNYRRNSTVQASAAFYDNFPVKSDELANVNSKFLQWHDRLNSKGSMSYLMATEDLSAASVTELARTLGFACTFHAIPHANDPQDFSEDSTKAGDDDSSDYHSDYEHANLTCSGVDLAGDDDNAAIGVVPDNTTCPPIDVEERRRTCAAFWPAPDDEEPLEVVAVMNLKRTPIADLLNWMDIYMLHGAQHIVLADNNCADDGDDVNGTREALRPYVDRGFLTLDESYYCHKFVDRSNDSALHMRYNVLTNSRVGHRLKPSTLVVPLDDDEWITMPNTTLTLRDLAASFRDNNLCASQVAWQQFGDNGHVCQPALSLAAAFTRRAPRLDEEPNATEVVVQIANAEIQTIAHPYVKGKMLYTYSEMEQCRTFSSHHCALPCNDKDMEGESRINCADWEPFYDDSLTTKGVLSDHSRPRPECAPFAGYAAADQSTFGLSPGLASGSVFISHYVFQSYQKWAEKIQRGRWDRDLAAEFDGKALHERSGDPSEYFDRVEDLTTIRTLQARVENVADDRLRSCLADAFFGGDLGLE